ncbi:MAG TPA: CPBP family intramembrane glutamic endopeptidase [Chitinophagaceae bacterium]|nr:CPBP family intramembrane glutamic endopeptidase [Chitinophagaceae bacterium]
MFDTDSKGISYTAGFFMLIAFVIAGIVITSLISIPIWTGMTGKPITEMEKTLTDPAYGNVSRILQSLTAIVAFFIPTVFTAWLLNRRPMKLLGYVNGIKPIQVGLVVVIMIAALAVSSALSYLNEIIPLSQDWKAFFTRLENTYNDQVTAIIGLKSTGEYILALVIMGFLPAVCEETLFRGGLQNFLTRATRMPWLSIVFISIIFSVVHLSWYGFLSRFFLGFLLGFIYHYSGRIWLNIIAHFLNNAIAITALYVYHLQGKPLKDIITDHGETLWGLAVLPVVIFLLMVFKRVSNYRIFMNQSSS